MSDQPGNSWGDPQNPYGQQVPPGQQQVPPQGAQGGQPYPGQPGPGQPYPQGAPQFGPDGQPYPQQYPPQPDAQQKRTGLIIGGVVAVVTVVIVAAVAAFFLLRSDDTDDDDRVQEIAESFTEVDTIDEYLEWGKDNLVDTMYEQEKADLATYDSYDREQIEDFLASQVAVGSTETPNDSDFDDLTGDDIDDMNDSLGRDDIDEDTLRSSRLVYLLDEDGDDVASLMIMKIDGKMQVAGVNQEY